MEVFLIRPPFLVGRMIWKRLLFVVIFYLISQFLRIVGCYYLAICSINVLDYSVKVPFRQDKYFLTFLHFVSFLGSGLLVRVHLHCIKMSSNSQRTSKDKPRSVKCRHFCLPFDSHNYCPSCRETNKGDHPCVTLQSPCAICASFSDEQMNKIKNRERYVRKQKADTSSDNELDLLGDVDFLHRISGRP